MSNGLQRVSQRKQVRSALERIDALEQELPRLGMAVDQALQVNGRRLGELASVLEAVVELLGASTVDAKIKEVADSKTMANMERAKQALEDALAKGELVKSETVTEKSLVVGREIDKNGSPIFPGRVQLTYGGIRPEFQEKLKGQAAGFSVETPRGNKFEVLEVYEVVEKQPEQPASEGLEGLEGLSESETFESSEAETLAPSEA
jgi:hypothetical protein